MTRAAGAATEAESAGTAGGGQAPFWGSRYWFAVPVVMVGLMALGALTGGRCF